MIGIIKNDIKFQYYYRFYHVYFLVSLFYISFIYILPESAQRTASLICILSDPSALGLFFIGAISLYEKSEHILNSYLVSPIDVNKYIFSKCISLGIISTIFGLIIALFHNSVSNFLMMTLGLFFGSTLFTLIGLIISSKIKTVNQFLMLTVPIEIIMFVPSILYIFKYSASWLVVHPAVAIYMLISGENIFALLSLFIWLVIIFYITKKHVLKMFYKIGGGQ